MDTIIPGTIAAYAGSADSLPGLQSKGWLLCDGKAYDRTNPTFTALFNQIGFSWGGDNGNVFHVPDLRGQFLRGVSQDSGVDPDAAHRGPALPGATNPGNSGNLVGSVQGDAFKEHNHTVGAGNNPPDASGGNFLPVMGSFIKPIATSNANIGGGSETRPVNKAVYFIIKF